MLNSKQNDNFHNEIIQNKLNNSKQFKTTQQLAKNQQLYLIIWLIYTKLRFLNLHNEIFIKFDEDSDDSWFLLVYLKDNNPNSEIIVEDKTNPEKNISNEYKGNEIFKFSDFLVDSLTNLLDREIKKLGKYDNYNQLDKFLNITQEIELSNSIALLIDYNQF